MGREIGFTSEHEAILKEHAFLYESLNTAGFMRNIDPPVFQALQKIYNEAVQVEHFTHWCSACVAEMVGRLYQEYYKWLFDREQISPAEEIVKSKPKRP